MADKFDAAAAIGGSGLGLFLSIIAGQDLTRAGIAAAGLGAAVGFGGYRIIKWLLNKG